MKKNVGIEVKMLLIFLVAYQKGVDLKYQKGFKFLEKDLFFQE